MNGCLSDSFSFNWFHGTLTQARIWSVAVSQAPDFDLKFSITTFDGQEPYSGNCPIARGLVRACAYLAMIVRGLRTPALGVDRRYSHSLCKQGARESRLSACLLDVGL